MPGLIPKKNGMSAIEGAAAFGRIDAAKYLMEHGAILRTLPRDDEPRALMMAKDEGHLALAAFLEFCMAAGVCKPAQSDAPHFTCNACVVNFSKKSALTRHCKSKHSKTTIFYCREQGCSSDPFFRKDTFERHRRTHSRKGYIICPQCKVDFRSDYFHTQHFDANGRCKKSSSTRDDADQDMEIDIESV